MSEREKQLSFQELNSRLVEAHERELQIWRLEAERLRALAGDAVELNQHCQEDSKDEEQVFTNGRSHASNLAGPFFSRQRIGGSQDKTNAESISKIDELPGDAASDAGDCEECVSDEDADKDEDKDVGTGVWRTPSMDFDNDLRTVWMDVPDSEEMSFAHGSPARFHFSDKELSAPDPLPTASSMTTEFDAVENYYCKVPIFRPTSTIRLAWDIAGAVLISYDCVVVPFEAAFRPEPSPFSIFMDWLTSIFWTMDIFFSFFTGYHSKGETVLSPSKIAMNYIRTWFIIDVLVVGLDVVSGLLLNQAASDVSDLGRIVRILRTIRVLRLLRLVKLKRIFSQIQDMIDSEYMYLVASLGKLLCFILTLNHFIACVWFFLGYSMLEAGVHNWISEYKMLDDKIWYQYTTSLHWTLTQFTPASMEVFPQNVAERSMAVVVLLFSLVAFSSFLASISASMTALRTMNQESNKQFWLLRRFLKQQMVALPVSSRILKYLEYACAKQEDRIVPADVKLLSRLSTGLKDELHYELTYVKMAKHPLFRTMVIEMEIFMVQTCALATKEITLASGDVLFHSKEKAQFMYFLHSGQMDYMPDGNQGRYLMPRVKAPEALGEATLWMSWHHKGRAHARTEAEIIALDAQKFADVALKYLDAWSTCAQYALVFQDSFLEAGPSDVFRDPDFFESVQDAISTVAVQCRSDGDNQDRSRGSMAGRKTGRATTLHRGSRSSQAKAAVSTDFLRFFSNKATAMSTATHGIQWHGLCKTTRSRASQANQKASLTLSSQQASRRASAELSSSSGQVVSDADASADVETFTPATAEQQALVVVSDPASTSADPLEQALAIAVSHAGLTEITEVESNPDGSEVSKCTL
eukprot:gb/GFBE01072714.1/.p1 GENE.gb/GFBE01072714.1/~~gb/GFBE01072714.1/.p1  ORF type:complete len:867 (+),score=202.97 gb/GFBE01072714.1/:1-2601(+)